MHENKILVRFRAMSHRAISCSKLQSHDPILVHSEYVRKQNFSAISKCTKIALKLSFEQNLDALRFGFRTKNREI